MKVTTITTVRLDADEVAEKNALSNRLKLAVSDYDLEISDANDLLEKANEKAESARQKLNAVLAEVNAFATKVHNGISDYINAQPAEFYGSDASGAVEAWRQAWEELDTTPVAERDREKFEDAKDGTGDILDDIEIGPKLPTE